MSRFEEYGISFQMRSITIEQAESNFAYSCKCCCSRGMRITCDRCAIATVYEKVITILGDK